MDISAYIESGIVETFVLGQASVQEQQEIACLSKIYPELATYIKEVEADFGTFAQQYQQTPPPRLKADIMAAIAQVNQDEPVGFLNNAPTATPQPSEVAAPTKEVKVVRLNRSVYFAAAASAFIAVAMGVLLILQNNKTEALQNQTDAIALENAKIEGDLKNAQQTLAILTNPNNNVVQLKGTAKFPDATATVYWDNTTGQVHIHAPSLAVLPADKVYQLWILVDGVPVDMGVFSNPVALSTMKNTMVGQTFAITIEKAGGSISPTLEEMVVVGNVS